MFLDLLRKMPFLSLMRRGVWAVLLFLSTVGVPTFCAQTPLPFSTVSFSLGSLQTRDPLFATDSPVPRMGWSEIGRNHKNRLFWLGAGEGTAGILAYHQAIQSWGESSGRFHIKNDWLGDGLAGNDEVSHLWWSYEIARAAALSLRWSGMEPKRAQIYGALQSALIMTLVEFPLDAYNPEQGLGISDLVFDYTGVALAVAKARSQALQNFDVKISFRGNPWAENHHFFSQNARDFDRILYWITYRPEKLARGIMIVGLGYQTDHLPPDYRVTRAFVIGLGTTLPDLLRPIAPGLARRMAPLGIYFLNLRCSAVRW